MVPDTNLTTENQKNNGSLLLEWGAIAILLLVMALVAYGLARPWMTDPDAGSQALARYDPAANGDAWLDVQLDGQGRPTEWTSHTIEILPPISAFASRLREAERDVLFEYYPGIEESSGSHQIMEIWERVQRPDVAGQQAGPVEETRLVAVREERGVFLISIFNQKTGTEIVFLPPVMSSPGDLRPDSQWTSTGSVKNGPAYTYEGEVVSAGAFPGAPDQFSDCLQVETRLKFEQNGQIVSEDRSRQWMCAGAGTLASETLGADGSAPTRRARVSHSRLPGAFTAQERLALLPPAQPIGSGESAAAVSDPAGWDWSRFARTRPRNQTAYANTFAPVWVPGSQAGDPPLLLAAAMTGDLYAFDASTSDGALRWRFHPGGTIYGAPAYDPQTGRIYFGSTDKRITALDRNGLFLWSFAVEDSIAARPLAAEGLVIAGSEDRRLYALDAATGSLVWRADTKGPVVSSPARSGNVVATGSDDGGVYAYDLRTGASLWQVMTGGPVEAPITAADGVFYAASRDETLYALDAGSGEIIWEGDSGQLLRTAPLVTEERVYVIDDFGRLLAFDRATGRRFWRTPEQDYVGPPVMLGEQLAAATDSGTVYAVDENGRRGQAWQASGARLVIDDSTPDYEFGPSVGGGALWLADNAGLVRRLGPPLPGMYELALSLDWIAEVTERGPMGAPVSSTPALFGGRVVVITEDGEVMWLDPEDGVLDPTGITLESEHLPLVEPVSAGNVLLAALGPTLHGLDPAAARVLWSLDLSGPLAGPPAAAGNAAYLSSGCMGSCADGKNLAVDTASGDVLWERPFSTGSVFPGGVLVSGSTAWFTTPLGAVERFSGEGLWEYEEDGVSGIGGPALSADGAILYAGAFRTETNQGLLLALDAADGSVLWRRDLGSSILSPYERIWLSGDTLVVPMLAGDVAGFSAADGSERWRYQAAAPRMGTVTVEDGKAWMLLENGRMTALDAASGATHAAFIQLDEDMTTYNRAQRPFRAGERWIAAGGWLLYAVEEQE